MDFSFHSIQIPPSTNAPEAPRTFTLTLAEDSVDDMYDGCAESMEKKVYEKYVKVEMNKENCLTECCFNWRYRTNVCTQKGEEIERSNRLGLTGHHIQAVCAYTDSLNSNLYSFFNKHLKLNEEETISSRKLIDLDILLKRVFINLTYI